LVDWSTYRRAGIGLSACTFPRAVAQIVDRAGLTVIARNTLSLVPKRAASSKRVAGADHAGKPGAAGGAATALADTVLARLPQFT
jgi:hypothetical protein